MSVVIVILALTGCSDRKLQRDVYVSLSRNLAAPEDAPGRAAFQAELKRSARLPSEAAVVGSELHPIPIRKGAKDFFESVVFIRTTLFTVSSPADRIMKEQIYTSLGAPPLTLKREVFDATKREYVIEEFYPGAAR